jgi:hypothetical protein
MVLGYIFQSVGFVVCERMLPEDVPMRDSVCYGLAMAGHAGDLTQQVLTRAVNSVVVSISQRGQELAAAANTAAVQAETSEERLPDVPMEIAGDYLALTGA